jgi:hypothetical protein
VLEKKRCHVVHFLAHKPGSALPEEDDGPVQVEDARDNNNSEHQEGAGDNDDSILDSLSPI